MRSIIAALDGVLAPLGYHRHKATWNRRSTEFVDVIDLQKSKAGNQVTANIGVLDPEIYQISLGQSAPEFVQEPYCTIRTRVHDPEGRELWWPISKEGSLDEIVTAIQVVGLPFVEQMHSRAAMRDSLAERNLRRRLVAPEALYWAVLEAELGNKTVACKRLGELQTRMVGEWKQKIGQVIVRLSCEA